MADNHLNIEAELKDIGAQMANVMFNMAQMEGERISRRSVEIMDGLRRKWDAAVCTPVSAPTVERQSIGSIGDYTGFCSLLDEFAYRASERRAMGGDFGSAEAEELAEAALIAYIDTWAARRDGAKQDQPTDLNVMPPTRGTGGQRIAAFQTVLTDQQIIDAWDAQWRYHGHEPCKVGHLEFGRTVEVMVASRCRFIGHKRRCVCKACYDRANLAAPAPGNTAQTAYVPKHVLEALQKGCKVATTLTPCKDATHTEAVQLVSDNH